MDNVESICVLFRSVEEASKYRDELSKNCELLIVEGAQRKFEATLSVTFGVSSLGGEPLLLCAHTAYAKLDLCPHGTVGAMQNVECQIKI